MNRTRDYYRKQRKRAIKRKSGILRKIGGEQLVSAWSHEETDRFSKRKNTLLMPDAPNEIL